MSRIERKQISQGEIVHRAWLAYKAYAITQGDNTGTIPLQPAPELFDNLSLTGLTSGEHKWLGTYVEAGLEALRLAKEAANDEARASRINGIIESADAVADSAEKIAAEAIHTAKELRRTGPANKGIAGRSGKVKKRKAV